MLDRLASERLAPSRNTPIVGRRVNLNLTLGGFPAGCSSVCTTFSMYYEKNDQPLALGGLVFVGVQSFLLFFFFASRMNDHSVGLLFDSNTKRAIWRRGPLA